MSFSDIELATGRTTRVTSSECSFEDAMACLYAYISAQHQFVPVPAVGGRRLDGYNMTALHELGHWTGHTSRLARDLSNPFRSEGYAREELRAEIASLMLGDELGIGHDPGQHVAYIESWIKVLEKDPREIFRAAADAEKITRFLQDFARQVALELEPIRERSFEVTDRMQVQARAIASAQASPQDYLRRYSRLEQSFGGGDVGAA